MTDPKLSEEYILFRLRMKTTISYEIIDAQTGKSYGMNTWVAALESILEDYPIDTLITFQWNDSNCISFKPMSIRDWLIAKSHDRGFNKETIVKNISHLEQVSANLHKTDWAA